MSYAQAVPVRDIPATTTQAATAPAASNVVPLRSLRTALHVYLTGRPADAHLATLLHSPLGVYVARTEVLRDSIHITFDIAPEDFGFTLHGLVTMLPEATIGSIVHQARN